MYNVNDTVMYSPCGVCRIEDITERDFSGENAEYYVLRPVGDCKSTFYVPTKNENLTGQMRKVLTRSEIDQLITLMPDEGLNWIEDENLRKEEYRRILRTGDRRELVRLIKTLYAQKQNRREQKKAAVLCRREIPQGRRKYAVRRICLCSGHIQGRGAFLYKEAYCLNQA